MKRQLYCRTLTIAGSDSGGGAGIQADLKTFAALGCYGMSVITAITAQNTVGVSGIHPVPVEMIVRQMEAVFTDLGTDAVKIGMLHSAEVIRAVAACLAQHQVRNVVLDPVMVAKSGDALLREDALQALRQYLLPQVDLITPNLPETQVLVGRPVTTVAQMEAAGEELLERGCQAVLVKGGHLSGDHVVDLLWMKGQPEPLRLESARIPTNNSHGTGCTLSSAIAACLAQGQSLEKAVQGAREYLIGALSSGKDYTLGQGHGPVHHFYAWWS